MFVLRFACIYAATKVYASNGAGSDVTTPLTVVFPKKQQPIYTQHEIQVSDQFMQKVLGELDPNGSGDPAARFVKINTEMRQANNKTLAGLRWKTVDRFSGINLSHASRTPRPRPPLPTCAAISTW
jgi:hypothetical protein